MSRIKFANTRIYLAVSYAAESLQIRHSALFFAVTNDSICATTAYLPFGSRLTYARWGVSLYIGYSHMRMAAVEYAYRTDTGAGNLFMWLSGEMIGCAEKWRIRSFWRDRGRAVPGCGLCPGSRGNLRAGRCFFLHSVPDLYQSILPIIRNP